MELIACKDQTLTVSFGKDEADELSKLLNHACEIEYLLGDSGVVISDIQRIQSILQGNESSELNISITDINHLFSLVWAFGARGYSTDHLGISASRLKQIDSDILDLQSRAAELINSQN